MLSTSQPRSPPDHDGDGGLPIMLFPSDSDSEGEMVEVVQAERYPALAPHPLKIETARTRPIEPRANAPPIPRHPIPNMQEAFAESLMEATQGGIELKPKLRNGDVKTRREELLDQDKDDAAPAALWRRRPGQECHELRRLMAQISFGVYLLLNGLANSQISVVSILQGHIDEVDEFLETTLEDMAQATQDLNDRIKHLKVPMDNMDVFEQMLEDRTFRLKILEGNEKIEHIVSRTETALAQTVEDLSEGVRSTKEFMLYLAEQQNGPWRQERPDVIDIFEAMKGNTDGWYNAFLDLQTKGNTLNALIERLTGMVADMERTAGEVSRRTRFSVQPFSEPDQSPRPAPRQSPRQAQSPSPRQSQGHNRQHSQDSTFTRSSVSSSVIIPNSPPRLSLRFSAIPTSPGSEGSYFDIPFASDGMALPGLQFQSGSAVEEEPIPAGSPPMRNPARMSTRLPARAMVPRLAVPQEEKEVVLEDNSQSEGTAIHEEKEVEDEEDDEKSDREDSPENDAPLYLLQPRTYTPQPPSPLPSPNLLNEKPKPKIIDTSKPRLELETPRPPAIPPRTRVESPMRGGDSLRLQIDPPKPRVVSPAPRVESPIPPMPRTEPPKPPIPVRGLNVGLQKESPFRLEADSQGQPQQRRSLRQRVSLKTNPPESIQVPPPTALELQRPVFPSPQRYQGPDSAYGSDIDRPTIKSMVETQEPGLRDFSPPVIGPALIPSPHSDQQFFRPVQASPHSPLQQRPHTSGTVTARQLNPNYNPHNRNIPSAMGMSMLSNVTTMTNDSTSMSGRTLKKKKSAFGWFKKAFSLDEEERAAFERKKQESSKNLYYEGRSPQFLDGKRLPPRPDSKY